MSTISKLLVLQELDIRIRQIEKELRDIPARKKEEAARLQRFQKGVADAKEALKACQASLKDLEVEAQSRRDRIIKFRQQQMELKTNKEFRAMEEEIKVAGNDIVGLEDKELVIMESIEGARAVLAEREKDLRAEEDAISKDVGVLEARKAREEEEVKTLRSERNAAAAEVDAKWLVHYERIFPAKDRALVPLEDGICGGCHMKLPPAVAHEARRAADVITCEYCGRLLYWAR